MLEKSLQNAYTLWKKNLETQHLSYVLDINSVSSCMDCKAKFTQNKYEVDSTVTVELYLRFVFFLCKFLFSTIHIIYPVLWLKSVFYIVLVCELIHFNEVKF